MKSSRKHPIIRQPRPLQKKSSMFSILPILRNIIAIAVFSGIYYYVFVVNQLYRDYNYPAFWILKFLIGYNILSAATRSIFAPLLALAAGTATLYVNATKSVPYLLSFINLSNASGWQLISAGAVGLLLTLIVKL